MDIKEASASSLPDSPESSLPATTLLHTNELVEDVHELQQSILPNPSLASHPVRHSTTKPFLGTGRQFRSVRDGLHRHIVDPILSRLAKETTKQPEDRAAEPERGGPQRGEDVAISVEDILEKLHPQGEHGFPEFDSLQDHGLQGEDSWDLHQREAKRLVRVAAKPTLLPQLNLAKLLEDMKGDEEDYYEVSRLSQRISTALTLCELENELIYVAYCHSLANPRRLQRQIQKARAACDMSKGEDPKDAHRKDQNARNSHRRRTEALFALIDYITAILAHLISQTAQGDYWINNMLAVLVAQTAKMKVFLTDIEAAAAIAAGIGSEALEHNATNMNAAREVDEEEECEEALRLIDANMKDGLTSDEEARVSSYCVSQNMFRAGLNAAVKNILLSLRFLNRSGLPPTCYEMCAVVYEIGFEGFMTALFQDKDLEYAASSDLQVLDTAQAAFTMVDGIFANLKSFVGDHPLQPRDTTTFVEWYYGKRQDSVDHGITADITTGIASGLFTGMATGMATGMQSVLHDHSKLQSKTQSIDLRHMSDILSVLIPLSTTSPIVLSNLTNFRTVMALSGDIQDLVTPFASSPFEAFCRLYTSEFDTGECSKGILRISTALHENQFSRCRLLVDGNWGTEASGQKSISSSSGLSRWSSLNLEKSEDQKSKVESGNGGEDGENDKDKYDKNMTSLDLPEIQRRLIECAAQMDAWVFDENSVTVDCSRYVLGVATAAVLIVSAGLGLGFSIGQRISGVDPFNLANYAWVGAAAVLLICKSILVRNWEWSDFLRRRVRCHSVSELAHTTGLPEQLIMAKLLHQDCGKGTSSSTILTTRGPYNSLFRRQSAGSGGNGFSIDRPIRPSTMMLSGIILLKVLTPKGDAMVCLDCRRGTECVILMHNADREVERLVCDDLTPLTGVVDKNGHANMYSEGPELFHHKVGSAKTPPQLRLTKTKRFKWKRMMGLYEFKDKDVVCV